MASPNEASELGPAVPAPAEAWSAGGAQPEGWQESTEASPWSAPAQPTSHWSGDSDSQPAAEKWAAPAGAAAGSEWSPSGADPAAPAALMPSSAVPEESTWSAPPPSEGGDLSPEPPAPTWTTQRRAVFAPLPAGDSLSSEEDGPREVKDEEAAALLRPVENDPQDASLALVIDIDPELQPVMDPTLQPLTDGESIRHMGSHDHPDLPIPVDENAPPMASGGRGVLGAIVSGEHRVAIHTRGGSTRRGSVTDLDLARPHFALQPQGGGSTEVVAHAEVKAIFFMLAPGEKPAVPSGRKVRVTLADGRAIEGHREGGDGPQGFFLVPVDAQKTNTRCIYVPRDAVTALVDL